MNQWTDPSICESNLKDKQWKEWAVGKESRGQRRREHSREPCHVSTWWMRLTPNKAHLRLSLPTLALLTDNPNGASGLFTLLEELSHRSRSVIPLKSLSREDVRFLLISPLSNKDHSVIKHHIEHKRESRWRRIHSKVSPGKYRDWLR